MTAARVTIAIPTYNRARSYLRQALSSALAQDYDAVEVIVSDNGSTDGTETLMRGYSDPRLRYIRHTQPLAPNDHFNFCLAQARGEYFLLLHDDDVVDPDFVSACIAAAGRRGGAGVVITGARRIDARGNVISEGMNNAQGAATDEFFLAWFQGRTPLYLCNTLYNTENLREIGGFRSRHNLFQDAKATFTLAARHGRADVADVKASFRVHSGELTGVARVSHWCEDSLELLEHMCGLAGDNKEEVRAQGMRFFANANYTRAARIRPLVPRVSAFLVVFRRFGGRYAPSWRLLMTTTALYRGLRRVKRRLLGLPEWAA